MKSLIFIPIYLKKEIHALSACITSFRMQEEDIVFLVRALNKAMKGW